MVNALMSSVAHSGLALGPLLTKNASPAFWSASGMSTVSITSGSWPVKVLNKTRRQFFNCRYENKNIRTGWNAILLEEERARGVLERGRAFAALDAVDESVYRLLPCFVVGARDRASDGAELGARDGRIEPGDVRGLYAALARGLGERRAGEPERRRGGGGRGEERGEAGRGEDIAAGRAVLVVVLRGRLDDHPGDAPGVRWRRCGSGGFLSVRGDVDADLGGNERGFGGEREHRVGAGCGVKGVGRVAVPARA